MEQKLLSINELYSLNEKVAIVTGGSQGIGEAIVRRLQEAGASVIIADVDEVLGVQLQEMLNARRAGSVLFRHCDVSNEDEVRAVVEEAIGAFGSLHIMVNNAGIFPFQPVSQLSAQEFMRVIEINLKGVFLGTKYAAQAMQSRQIPGTIITVASIDALHPSSVGLAAYDASKHGVWGFVKNAALEYSAANIRINAIAPGGIATPGVAKMMPDGQIHFTDEQRAGIPMGRLGDPDEIARVALFLASDMSTYMTGSLVVADGGKLLM